MKVTPTPDSQFPCRIVYSTAEIDEICEQALAQSGLMPNAPQAIRIDRFIEKHFGCTPEYEDLGEAVMGYTLFNNRGKVLKIGISEALVKDEEQVSLRKERSTLAHEAGHGLLHAMLFMEDVGSRPRQDAPKRSPKILCRSEHVEPVGSNPHNKYNGKWWEWQANRAIGGLLLPKLLVTTAAQPFLVDEKNSTLMEMAREQFITDLASQFDVNRIVAQIRINELFPA